MKQKLCIIAALMVFFNAGFSVNSFADGSVDTETAINEELSKETTEESNVINLWVNVNSAGEENTYKNLNQAISAAGKLDKSENQVIINIKGGTYDISQTLVLGSTDGGSEKYPLIIRAADGEQVIFNAGSKVTGIPIPNDDASKKKIPQHARNKVYKVDLSNLKNKDFGDRNATGVNMGSTDTSVYGDVLEIIYDGVPMPRASYPNIGSEYIDRSSGGTAFHIENPDFPIKNWDLSTNLGWVQYIDKCGYIYGQSPIISYDPAAEMITGIINGGFSFEANGRIRFKNLPEFIDQPGEYCVDFNNKCIYFYPPDENFRKSAYITLFKEPIIQFNEVENIIIDGVTVQNGGGDGVVFNKSNNCSLTNSTVKNFSGNGVQILNSTNIELSGCSINNVGLHGVFSYGSGDYRTLTSSGNVIKENDVYTNGRTTPVGVNGIEIHDETGTKVVRNRVHDITHSGIILTAASTACIVEENEVYNCVNDTYDAGAIYNGGAKFKGVGNIFKNNYIHDIYLTKDAKGGSVIGLYWDDQQSGNTAEGNIFDDMAFGMLVGGGDWNTINGNIFYKLRASGTVDARGEGWQKSNDVSPNVKNYEEQIGLGNSIWDSTYPYLKKLYEYSKANNVDKVAAPDELTLTNNIYIDTPEFTLAGSASDNAKAIENNIRKTAKECSFEDADNYNFTDNSSKIDFSNIGIASKSLGKTSLLGPADGAAGIEGNNIVLSWKDTNGADRYRVRIGVDEKLKLLVYDEVIQDTRVQLDNLKYGRTYYWAVEPIISSKSETAGYMSDIYSFSTAKNEKKDTSELDSLLRTLGNGWKRVTEGNRPGMYEEGSIAELEKVVSEAETVFYNNASKMYTVKNVTAKLKNAITDFNNKMKYEIVDFGEWQKDKDNWIVADKSVFNGDKITLNTNSTPVITPTAGYSGAQLSRGQLLKFKVKLDFSGYQMWGLNAEDPSGYAWARQGYAIVAKRDMFEIHKNQRIIKTFANEESIMTSDVWHTVEIGILSTTQGPRILMTVDGKIAVDYIDESGEPADSLGYFIFTEQSGGIGMDIAPADYTE